jgi:hypothetical protein
MTAAVCQPLPEIAAYLSAVREHEARLRRARREAEAERQAHEAAGRPQVSELRLPRA